MASNPHLSSPLIEWGAESADMTTAVLAVHGRGQSPDFMREQSHRLDVADVRYFAPAADGDSWYPRPFLEPIDANQPSLNHALDAIDARVDALVESGIDTARLVVWGFSQGACLLAHWALTRPQPVGGIILFTGGYIGPEDVVAQAQSLDGVPVVVRSIEHDPFVPPERVTQTVTALRAAGADVDALIVPGDEHIITDEAIDAARKLLRREETMSLT